MTLEKSTNKDKLFNNRGWRARQDFHTDGGWEAKGTEPHPSDMIDAAGVAIEPEVKTGFLQGKNASVDITKVFDSLKTIPGLLIHENITPESVRNNLKQGKDGYTEFEDENLPILIGELDGFGVFVSVRVFMLDAPPKDNMHSMEHRQHLRFVPLEKGFFKNTISMSGDRISEQSGHKRRLLGYPDKPIPSLEDYGKNQISHASPFEFVITLRTPEKDGIPPIQTAPLFAAQEKIFQAVK